EVDRLASLVEDLLFLARSDAGALPLARERVDLAGVVSDAAPALEVLAARAGVAFRVEPSPPVAVQGSAPLLFRVVFNLAENAVKHAGGGAHVTVSTYARDGHALLEVRDDGPGIPNEDRERIFDRFYRADPARERGGSGLGLPLTPAIVQLHGGEGSVPGDAASPCRSRLREKLLIRASRDSHATALSHASNLRDIPPKRRRTHIWISPRGTACWRARSPSVWGAPASASAPTGCCTTKRRTLPNRLRPQRVPRNPPPRRTRAACRRSPASSRRPRRRSCTSGPSRSPTLPTRAIPTTTDPSGRGVRSAASGCRTTRVGAAARRAAAPAPGSSSARTAS